MEDRTACQKALWDGTHDKNKTDISVNFIRDVIQWDQKQWFNGQKSRP